MTNENGKEVVLMQFFPKHTEIKCKDGSCYRAEVKSMSGDPMELGVFHNEMFPEVQKETENALQN